MNLVVVTVVKSDLTGLKATEISILDQSLPVEWKIVTPFDNSETHQYSLKLLNEAKISELLEDEGRGVYSAMNKAIFRSSSQDWLWFINAGDQFASQDSYRIVSSALTFPTSRWVYGGHFLGSESRKILGEFKSPKEFKITNQLFAKKYISHQATVFQSSLLWQLSGFDPRFKIAADWDLMTRASQIETPMRINDSLCIFYMGGISTKTRQESNSELLLIRNEHFPKYLLLKSYSWYVYRLFRNFFVQSIEENLPEFANRIRKIRIHARDRFG